MTGNETNADGSDSNQCRNPALFFHVFPAAIQVFSPLILSALAIAFTVCLYNIATPKDPKANPEPAISSSAEVTATEAPSPSLVTEEAPPPYQPAAEAAPSIRTAGEEAPIPKIPKELSAAEAFVKGTLYVILLILSIVLCGLSIQSLINCSEEAAVSRTGLFVIWTPYAILCDGTSLGLACYAMLFRNLWGKKTIKKYPIDASLVPVIIPGLAILPVFMVGWGLYAWTGFLVRQAVKAVEACQRRLCGVELDEEENIEDRTSFELEEGTRTGAGEDPGEGRSSHEHQETEGLITGAQK